MKLSDPNGYLRYTTSAFFVIDKNAAVCNPVACRESFGNNCFGQKTEHIGYVHSAGIPDSFPKFWREVEKRLGLKEAEIQMKPLPNTVLLEVDPFWRPNGVRRGFFTMLLRCGVCYPADEFERSLNFYPYTKEAKNAVLYFLDGHTTPTFDEAALGAGVLSKFRNLSREQVQPLLVKFIVD